ncbi:helix-turn-helix transcriptional regulator [Vibrio sp. HN007]|uniref:helix-turn-helix transcriptional regulator n=1 Tax=Vibrio iocasae TaxID=3098914 RepID=UPI0035D423B6
MKQNIYPYVTEELKRLLKKQSISYKNLGEHLDVSEKTIVRSLNNKQEFSLERLTSICSLLKISLTELFSTAEKSMEQVFFFTSEQDEAFSSEPDLYALLIQLYKEQDISMLAVKNSLKRSDIYLMLRKLENIGVVTIGKNDRITIKTPKHATFHPKSRYASMIYKKTINDMSEVCSQPKLYPNTSIKIVNVDMTKNEYSSFLENMRSYFVEMLREQHKNSDRKTDNYTIALMVGEGNYLPDFSELGSLKSE